MSTIPQTFQEVTRFQANPNDLFVTSQDVANHTVAALKKLTGITGESSDFFTLDPGCGTGVWGRAVNKIFDYPMSWGIDIENRLGHAKDLINPEPYDFYYIQDYLTFQGESNAPFSLICGNPPYSSKTDKNLAEKFLMKSLQLVKPGGIVGLLLKTEYVASLRRYENIYRSIAPKYMIQYVPRIKWEGYKFSNTIEYAFYIWQKGCKDRTQLYWLNWKTGELI